ncbi:formyltransferase family protein [Halomarina salina]|uniref:Formyltransferase family protein n=1 Tax=Halomarina salina TaxID=1872699 RepID=A0ABD5RNE7_9EURY|nr:formyltransferase family protein [Halomarina salina]
MDVALLLNGPRVRDWQAAALAYLLDADDDVEVTAIVYNEYENDATALETLRRAVELREWAAVATLNNLLVETGRERGYVDIDTLVDRDAVRELSVHPTIVDGWKQRIPAETVDEFCDDVDVAIRFGFGFLVGPVLSELDHGVLSYHHGDLTEYRGQPMGFWEFVHGRQTAGITVQQLTETLDGGGVAASKTVDICDLRTWEAVKRRLLEESEDMLATAVQSLRDGTVREPDHLGDLYTLPKGRPVLTFAVKNAWGHFLEGA